MKNETQFFKKALTEATDIISSPLTGEREKFAQLITFCENVRLYHCQYCMEYMNFKDLDVSKYFTENFELGVD